MSVYGGFLTKKQSIQYFSILEDIIKLMQSNVMDSFTKNLVAYAQFRNNFLDLYKQLKKLETRKYMQPKYSLTLQPLFNLCFDHQYFVANSPIPEAIQQSQENDRLRNFRTVKDIKESMNLNSRSIVKDSDNSFQGIELMWREPKSKTSRQTRIQKQENAVTSTTNQPNTLTTQQRPNTTSLTYRKSNRVSLDSKIISLREEPSLSRRAIYESFQKDYALPPPPRQYERKLDKLRKCSKIKYSIDQLF